MASFWTHTLSEQASLGQRSECRWPDDRNAPIASIGGAAAMGFLAVVLTKPRDSSTAEHEMVVTLEETRHGNKSTCFSLGNRLLSEQ
ncbi:hypothetical protein KIL84_000820 [Mauremys mutica]|uniref:Uncharacterized protein n=1 Tax=Mauremys mutica TaxID=74926 RepID=A0A9D3WZK0_9SAUR|nr:hypothetical protein KIL84_000820 [Mauremys mutica]